MSTALPRALDREGLALAADALAARDRDLAAIVERHGRPPLWARRPGFVTLIRIILEAGYAEHLQETYTNFRSRLEDLEQLAEFARQFRSLEDFLAQLSLLSNLEVEDDKPVTVDEERVRLSTIHQAKGLEFDVVFVIMLCDGLFPNARSLDRPESEEEERRLFYVAITRARNELYLTYPLVRTMGGGGHDVFQQPSRFLREIPEELLDPWNLQPFAPGY